MRQKKTMNAKHLIKNEISRLLPHSNEAKAEVRILFEEITGKSYMTAQFGDTDIAEDEAERISEAVTRIINGEPIQYVLGRWSFMGNGFIVTPDVLIPRQDTEISTELAIKYVNEHNCKTVLDLCCGSGCIGISIAKACKGVNITCADISVKALDIAKRNIELNGVTQNATALQTDMFSACGAYDLIISNPPYIPTDVIDTLDKKVKDNEPMTALDGGEDGLHFYRIIASEARAHLNDNGMLILEIGYDQGESVTALLKENGYNNVRCVKDYSGNDRVVTADIGG